MIERIGFSYIGLLFLLMLTIPNLIWMKHQPEGYQPENENKILLCFERAGQILVTSLAIFTKSFNIGKVNQWIIWLIIAFIIMILYECWWGRYFKSNQQLSDFYSSFLGVPVAGASLPVMAFFLLAIYGKSVLMMAAVTILGIGHIGIHLQHKSRINNLTEDI